MWQGRWRLLPSGFEEVLIQYSLDVAVAKYEKACANADQKMFGELRNRRQIKENMRKVNTSSRNLSRSFSSLHVRVQICEQRLHILIVVTDSLGLICSERESISHYSQS